MTVSRRATSLLSLPFALGLCIGIAGTGVAAGVLGSDTFGDVQRGSFYDEAIGEMYDLGIIKGYENGNFGPNDYVTRGQIAVMLARFRDEMSGTSHSSAAEEEEDAEDAEDEEDEEDEEESSSSSARSSVAAVVIPAEGAIRFTAKSFTVNETAGLATISVVRTNGNAGAVSADYTIVAGTATAGADYTLANGTVSFAVRETSRTFTIAIGDDTSVEGLESFTVELSNVKGGAIISTPSSATVNIVDNESTGSAGSAGAAASSAGHEVAFNAGAYAVSENIGTANITLKRTGGTGPVTVNYALTNGTGILGTDYDTTNGSVTFEASETSKTFAVTVKDEGVIDGSKTVHMTLSSPTGGAKLGNPATALLTIIDNETTAAGTGSLKLSLNTFDVLEGETVVITVLRVGGTQGTVTVNYASSDGSARSGSDYVSAAGTLTFLPGESSKSFTVRTNSDELAGEGEETFTVNISGPAGGAGLLSPSSSQVRIGG